MTDQIPPEPPDGADLRKYWEEKFTRPCTVCGCLKMVSAPREYLIYDEKAIEKCTCSKPVALQRNGTPEMTIPEPPDGTAIVCTNNMHDIGSFIFYRDDKQAEDCEYAESGGDATQEHRWFETPAQRGPWTWKKIQSFGQIYEIGAKLDASISPDQMQDGKRYAVTVEGVYEKERLFSHTKNEQEKLDTIEPSLLGEYGLWSASRIEEIGGEQ